MLTPLLDAQLSGSVISECFTQEKDECILRFETARGPFFIRTNLAAAFSCISFPKDFNRSKRNNVDLFPEIIGQRIVSLVQTPFDRSITLMLSNNFALLFKMHSNRANLILYRDEKVVDVFRKKLTQDWTLIRGSLERSADWSYENFLNHSDKPQPLFFTLGKVVWTFLNNNGFASKRIDKQWEAIQDVLKHLEKPNFEICILEEKLTFSLLPVGKLVKRYEDPILALTEYHQRYVQRSVFDIEKASLHAMIRKKIQSTTNSYQKSKDRLAAVKLENNFKIWADLLMANLYNIKQGQEHVTVDNFYNDNIPVTIKLKREFTAQKNAEVYYNKSKKQQLEIDHLDHLIKERKNNLVEATEALESLSSIADLKSLRALASKYQWTVADDDAEPLPFHEHVYHGFRILVGKNAISNDRLIQKHSYKEDLWLHAKDVTGSHVLIKYQSGKVFPKDVIERAAEIAAYNSKRKTDSLCPVMITPRKFIRKRKGDTAGAVVVERERVIMVVPKE